MLKYKKITYFAIATIGDLLYFKTLSMRVERYFGIS